MSTPYKCVALSLVLATSMAMAAPDTTRLELGDPERRNRTAPVSLDGITDTRSGELISSGELAQRLAQVNVLFLGENHTDIDYHRVQFQVIRALHQAGREVIIGLEMFPYTRQGELDQWVAGEFSEAEFLDQSDWYLHWGYHWGYYADIFRFARDQGLRMVGVNAPRHVITAVRTEGFDELSEEDRRHLPERVITGNGEHRTLFEASFEADDSLHAAISDDQLEGMLRAQATWDAVMGWNAARAFTGQDNPDAIVVVLIGAGHVTYGLGCEFQIQDGFDGGTASLVPVPLVDYEGQTHDQVQASYADFIWGLPPTQQPIYPSLGVSLSGRIGKYPNKVIQVSEDSVAEAAGIQVGDLVVSLDGRNIDSVAALRQAVSAYGWGDSAALEIQRDEESITKTVLFRRNEESAESDQ